MTCSKCGKVALSSWSKRGQTWTLRTECCDALTLKEDGKPVTDYWVKKGVKRDTRSEEVAEVGDEEDDSGRQHRYQELQGFGEEGGTGIF